MESRSVMRRVLAFLAALALPALFWAVVGQSASAVTPPPTPFTQCPAVGLSPTCETLIVVNPDNSISVYSDPNVGPYDGIEDALVGVQNNSASAVTSLTLSGNDPNSFEPAFGFDGDGLCTFGISGCPFGPTGYEGPGTSFSNISSDETTGTVNFLGAGGACSGLPAGKSAYFSLEGDVTADTLMSVTTTQSAYAATIQVGGTALNKAGPVSGTAPMHVAHTLLTANLGLIHAQAVKSEVTTGLGSALAEATIANLSIGAPVGVVARGIDVVSASGCGGHTGGVTFAYLKIGTNPALINYSPPVNKTFSLGLLGKLVFNEQFTSPAGFSVNAIHLHILNPTIGNALVGTATSNVVSS